MGTASINTCFLEGKPRHHPPAKIAGRGSFRAQWWAVGAQRGNPLLPCHQMVHGHKRGVILPVSPEALVEAVPTKGKSPSIPWHFCCLPKPLGKMLEVTRADGSKLGVPSPITHCSKPPFSSEELWTPLLPWQQSRPETFPLPNCSQTPAFPLPSSI